MNDTVLLNDLVSSIIRGLIIPLIPVITGYLVSLINKLTEELNSQLDSQELLQYTEVAETAIQTAISTVYQTYIDDIMKSSRFLTDDEVQIAFNMIKEKSKNIISSTIVHELEKKYQNLDNWLENKISYYLNSESINFLHLTYSGEMEVTL
ncbi:hypothetical protein Amet_1487 [Alkaliphilus metalliredigens QYMF]|uniref:Uncharacterized protein n=1 Tax=Alkaliphilus metalliredigens (strain QYMF) TaxID=293826 RepID=A6TNB5_ALKMQ|nr:hypothetical protein [Alkaliphilus metalliredigens]ABR47683.1 hypothetical protein Amet_1487 [Alkaliphilus metalliredigens QYMF]